MNNRKKMLQEFLRKYMQYSSYIYRTDNSKENNADCLNDRTPTCTALILKKETNISCKPKTTLCSVAGTVTTVQLQ